MFFFLFRKKDNKQGTSYDATEDEDVRDERENIEKNENDSDDTIILKIHKLTKVFRRSLGQRNIAVNNISVGVKSGEVLYFSFLRVTNKTFQLVRSVFSFHVEMFFLQGEPKTRLVIKRSKYEY